MINRHSYLLISLLVLAFSCSKDEPDEKLSSRSFQVGIAPIPRNYPGTQNDWEDMFNKIKDAGELVTAQNPWRESISKSGEIPEIIALLGNQKNNYGYEPFYGINFFTQIGNYEPDLSLPSSSINNWSNEEAKKLYKKVALNIASSFKPRYFALALEVNAYYIKHADDFNLFLQFYKTLYDSVKSISPQTKVCVTFQLEMMKGLGDKTWGFNVEPHWELLEKFGDKLDILVFTSYPEVEYGSPGDIPDNYYADIRSHSLMDFAISEVGWSSTRNNEDDQVKFINKMTLDINHLNPEFINWIFMHDLPGNGPLTKTGIRNTDGSEKKAWKVWCDIKKIDGGAE